VVFAEKPRPRDRHSRRRRDRQNTHDENHLAAIENGANDADGFYRTFAA
jgi:hypothetical protein